MIPLPRFRSIPFGSFTSTSGFAPTSSTDLKLSIKTNTNRSSQDFSGNNTGNSGGFSYKNTSRRNSTQQDLTMNTMLQSLRMNRESQKTSQSNKIISLKNNIRASMFMTINENENDFAVLEEPSAVENDDSDDSDVGIDDFRPKKVIQEENNMIKSSKFSDSMNSLNDGCYDNATATSTIRSTLPTICPTVDVHVPPPELRSSNSLISKIMSDDFFDHDEPLKKVIGITVMNSLESVHVNDTTIITEDVDLQSI